MHLLDQIALARKPVLLQRTSGEVVSLPGAARRAADLAATPLRYVLDRSASDSCLAFIGSNEGMFDPENELLRVFADRFWMEWTQPAGGGCAGRVGILVEAAARGRRGRVQSFWETPGEEPEMAQAAVEFDLDAPIAERVDHRQSFRLSAAHEGAVARLVRHLSVRVHPEWIAHLQAGGAEAYRRAVGAISGAIWHDLVFALAFSAMLGARERLVPTAVERGRLNRRRAERGQPALLDHTEVTLRLDAGAAAQGTARAGQEGVPRRLHYVRGHMVRRYGKVFWRTAHLRGDTGAEPSTRTVRVRGGRA